MPDITQYMGDIDGSKPEVLLSAMQAFMDFCPDMVFIKDKNLRFVAGTRRFAEMMGKDSMAELLGLTDMDVLEDKALARRYMADDRTLLAKGENLTGYIEPLNSRGGTHYSSTSKYVLKDRQGEPLGILGISRDATADIKRSQRYQRELEYLFTLPEDVCSVVFIDVTDWRIVRHSRQGLEQAAPPFLNVGEFCAAAYGNICDSSGDGHAFYRRFTRDHLLELHEQGHNGFTFEYRRRLFDNKIHWVRDEVVFLSDPQTGHVNVVILVRDIDRQKQEEEAMAKAAVTDELTGLLNRAAMRQRTEEFLRGEGARGMHAAFLIDVDDFKKVNDTYGHSEGDALLAKLAGGIQNCFRETDIVGRPGGDEFFVLAKNLPKREAATRCAEKLLGVVHELRATQVSALTSVSVGISLYPSDGRTLDELYAKADEALYKAKASGKNCAAFAADGNTLWHANANAMRYEAYNSRFVDGSGAIGYISDMDSYELLHVTRAGMELYGLAKPEDYLGRKCHEVISGLDKPCPFCPNAMLREGTDYRWEHREEGIGRWFDCTSSIIRLDGRTCHLEHKRDITERMEEMSALSGKLTMEDVIFRCLRILAGEKDMTAAVNRFLETVGGYYLADRAYLIEFNFQDNTVSNTFEWCRQGVSAEIGNLQGLPMALVADWVEMFRSKGEFFLHSLRTDLPPESPTYQILEAQGIRSLMAAPLYSDGVIVGFIGVDNPGKMQGNLALLRSVAEFVQAELERRRLMSELERLSYTDALTGLKNRNQYDGLLKTYKSRMPDTLGAMFIGVNGLKGFNAAHSHLYGNHILQRAAGVIRENVSGEVYRVGGDEYAVFDENISREAFEAELAALHRAFAREGEYSVSIGGAWSGGGEDIAGLLLRADREIAAEKQAYYRSVMDG